MSNQETEAKLADDDLKSLSEMTGIKPDLIKASGLPDERLKELFDVASGFRAFHKRAMKGMWVGVAIIPGLTLGLSYAFGGAAGMHAAAFPAVGMQFGTLLAVVSVMIGRDIRHRHDPVPSKEIKDAIDRRLLDFDAKERGQAPEPK